MSSELTIDETDAVEAQIDGDEAADDDKEEDDVRRVSPRRCRRS